MKKIGKEEKNMGYMENINNYLKHMKNKGYEAIQAINLLAGAAGLEWFNPFRATEEELEVLAENIGDLEDWE